MNTVPPKNPIQVPIPQSTILVQPTPDHKPIIFIVIIVTLIILGTFYFFLLNRTETIDNVKPVSNIQNKLQPQVKVLPSVVPTVTITVMDSSDSQLDIDMQSINNKLSGLTTDVNNVDQGLNDKPIDSGL